MIVAILAAAARHPPPRALLSWRLFLASPTPVRSTSLIMSHMSGDTARPSPTPSTDAIRNWDGAGTSTYGSHTYWPSIGYTASQLIEIVASPAQAIWGRETPNEIHAYMPCASGEPAHITIATSVSCFVTWGRCAYLSGG